MARVTKDEYYLDIAKAVSKRSPCLKRKVGAVIVKDDCIVSTGYNGPPRGESHCDVCYRLHVESGHNYQDCPSVHAEENSIINAARYGMSINGGVLYLYADGNVSPCQRCSRAIINAGIKDVIYNKELATEES